MIRRANAPSGHWSHASGMSYYPHQQPMRPVRWLHRHRRRTVMGRVSKYSCAVLAPVHARTDAAVILIISATQGLRVSGCADKPRRLFTGRDLHGRVPHAVAIPVCVIHASSRTAANTTLIPVVHPAESVGIIIVLHETARPLALSIANADLRARHHPDRRNKSTGPCRRSDRTHQRCCWNILARGPRRRRQSRRPLASRHCNGFIPKAIQILIGIENLGFAWFAAPACGEHGAQ